MSLLDTASLIITPNGYKEGTLYSVIPNTTLGDMTVVRATTATRVNSAGLIELVPYNLLQYSEQFNNGVWGLYSSGTGVNPIVTANTTTAPNGTITADTIVLNAGAGTTINDQSGIYQIFQEATGVTYTCSFYAKGLVGGEQVMVRHANGILYTKFTLTNDWARYTLTETAISTGTIFLEIVIRRSLNEPINASATFYIWGAQLVEGTLPKDYLRTETRLNIPRLDYSNGSCPSLLVEPQRTNAIGNSNAISGYFFSGVAVINAVTSPEGITNAFSFDVNNNTNGGLSPITLTTSAQSYTFSVYLKGSVNSQKVKLYGDLNGTIQEFTLTTSWERYTKTFTGAVGAQSIYLLNGSYFSPAQNDLYYGYGLQLEVGAYATSLIPTTSASVTRNADQVYKTGISSLIGQTEGVIFVEGSTIGIETVKINLFAALEKTSSGATMRIYYDGNSNVIIGDVYNGSSFSASFVGPSIQVGQTFKAALAYKNNNFVFYVNGSLIGTDTSGSVPTTDDFKINTSIYSNADAGVRQSIAVLFPTRLTNAELAQLTTL